MAIDTSGTWVGEDSHDDRCESTPAEEPSDPGDQPPLGTEGAHFAGGAPSTVWFGPPGYAAVEVELMEFLGSHDGVAVLQCPRDLERGTHLSDLGIPCLWFIGAGDEPPTIGSGLHEWLPRSASCGQVHASLARLSQRRATPRETGRPVLEADDLLGRRRQPCSTRTSSKHN
jgi:hypothetical protein